MLSMDHARQWTRASDTLPPRPTTTRQELSWRNSSGCNDKKNLKLDRLRTECQSEGSEDSFFFSVSSAVRSIRQIDSVKGIVLHPMQTITLNAVRSHAVLCEMFCKRKQ